MKVFTSAARFFSAIFVLTILLVPAQINQAQTANGNVLNSNDAFAVTAERLHSPWDGKLNEAGWRYKAGDDAARAAKDFDDSDWVKLPDTQFYSTNFPPENWTGEGWFRLRVSVDEPLAREAVALRFLHWGASEIYLDGELLRGFGKIAPDANGGETEQNPHGLPVPLTFRTSGEHVIAVHYSFTAAKDLSQGVGAWLARGRLAPGFNSYLQTGNTAVSDSAGNIRDFESYKLFIGVLYSFALLHFLLFIFYRRERTNLFYSLFAFSLANATFFNTVYNYGNQTALISAFAFVIFALSYGTAFVALQAFLYEAFAPRFSNVFRFTALLLVVQLLILFIFLRERVTFYATCVVMIISLADSLRLVASAIRQRRDGAWIIAVGVLILAVGILMSIAAELGVFRNSQFYSNLNDVTLYLGFPIAVSVFLARNFARTNRHLAEQLVQVKDLSEKELAQSHLNAELALEREQEKARLAFVEAENARQTKELEEARQLQLSMLPKKLPDIPNLEIAAYMRPASEVGGDYYDFHVSDDGTLTVAVGDATGHGLKAGTVVTATKGLFNNLAHAPDIADTFGQISRSLKAMNLRGLFMAMTMLKIKDNRLIIGMAGMPSVLIYRTLTGQIEEIAIRAMPLGGFSKSAYVSRELNLSAGDCIVIMSDGFPEMFNEDGEMLADDTAKYVLAEIARQSPREIINRFVEVGEKWAGARPPDDDVTFVVLQVK